MCVSSGGQRGWKRRAGFHKSIGNINSIQRDSLTIGTNRFLSRSPYKHSIKDVRTHYTGQVQCTQTAGVVATGLFQGPLKTHPCCSSRRREKEGLALVRAVAGRCTSRVVVVVVAPIQRENREKRREANEERRRVDNVQMDGARAKG